MIACFLSNVSAKYYKNPSMLSRVIAKNVGDVFLRHSVHCGRFWIIICKFLQHRMLQFGLISLMLLLSRTVNSYS